MVSKVPGEEGMAEIHLQLRNDIAPTSAYIVLVRPSLLNPTGENLEYFGVWLDSSNLTVLLRVEPELVTLRVNSTLHGKTVEVGQWLSALAEDLSWIPNTHIRWITTACNSNSR